MKVIGTDNADLINGGYKNDSIDGGLGNDTLNGGAGNDTLNGGEGQDSLNGGSGDDVIYDGLDSSGYSMDTIVAGAGDDVIHWTGGFINQIDGGSGHDVLTTVGATHATILYGSGSDSDWNIEQFVGGDQVDIVSITRNDYAVQMDTSMSGGGGDDSLAISGPGVDSLVGGGGDDTLSIDTNLSGGSLSGGEGDDTLGGSGLNHLLFDGGTGRDLANLYQAGSEQLTISLANQGAWQTDGATDVYLTGIEDVALYANSSQASGDGGSNWISADASDDTIDGAGGDDTLAVSASTVAHGGDGIDTLFLANFYYYDEFTINLADAGKMVTVDDNGGRLTFDGIENVSGVEGSDNLTGDKHDNVIYGGGGSDLLSGGAGADVLHGDMEVTRLGTSLIDRTDPNGFNLQNDKLDGGTGADKLFGEFGNDSLVGGGGNDTLDGGAGRDILSGGTGTDTFVFSAITDSSGIAEIGSPDLITDLTSHEKIDLSAIDADTTTDGDQAFHRVDAFTRHAGELVMEFDPQNNVTHVELDVNGDGAQDMIIDLTGNHVHFDGFVL